MKKLCLVLSGGGARGFAHVGAIKAIEELNLDIDTIIVSSMGAVIGAKYALNTNIDEIKSLCAEFSQNYKHYLNTDSGIGIKAKELKIFFQRIYNRAKVSDTKIKLKLIVSDFDTGKPEVLDSSSSLVDGVLASISMPFINSPVTINNRRYIDPGLSTNFPLEFYNEKNCILLGINSGSIKIPTKNNSSFTDRLIKKEHIYHLIYSANHNQQRHTEHLEQKLSKKHIILNLAKTLENFQNYSFEEFDSLYNIGYQSIIDNKNEILKKLQ